MESSQKNLLHRYWSTGPLQKAVVIASSVLIFMCLCCSGFSIYALTPAGQAFVSEINATSTAQANATATQNAIYALTPHPTNIPRSTSTRVPTSTLQPTGIPTVMSTNIPKPTNTSTSTPVPVITSAILGGVRSAFQAKYPLVGADLFQTDNETITFSINLLSGTDGQEHVFEILAYRTDATLWTPAQAKSICTRFIPSDAQYQRDTTNGNNLTQVYQSPSIGATFPGKMFTGVSKGTFGIDYVHIAGSGDNVFQCDIMVGP